MWFLTILLAVGLLICLRIRKSLNYWRDRNIPHLKHLTALRNAAQLLLGKMTIMEHMQFLYSACPDKRYYGTIPLPIPQLVVRDPDLIKQITIKDFDYFTDRITFIDEDAEPLFTKILQNLKGEKWRDMRSTLSPTFSSSKIKYLFTLVSDCAKQFTNHFLETTDEKVMNVEIKDALSRFTNDAIATAAFGITVDSLKDRENDFFLTGKDLTNIGGLKALKLLAHCLIPSIMRIFKIPIFSPASFAFLRRIVKETIRAREEKGVVRPDMIHILMDARNAAIKDDALDELSTATNVNKHQISTLSEDDITAQALIFFFAGFTGTLTVMSFLAYELAIDHKAQLRLQQEIDKAVDHHNGKTDYDTVLGVKYLDMVVSEALRKWTPGFSLDRKCVKDYEIPPKLAGKSPVVINKGTTVVIPVVGIHHDPNYFPNPHKFDPERFSDEKKSSIKPFTYMPFGVGPRNCIASRFALMEIKILFFHLLREFDIVPTSKTTIPLVLSRKTFEMLPDDGLWLGFKQRTK